MGHSPAGRKDSKMLIHDVSEIRVIEIEDESAANDFAIEFQSYHGEITLIEVDAEQASKLSALLASAILDREISMPVATGGYNYLVGGTVR